MMRDQHGDILFQVHVRPWLGITLASVKILAKTEIEAIKRIPRLVEIVSVLPIPRVTVVSGRYA